MTPFTLSIELGLDETELVAGRRFWREAGGAHLLQASAAPWTEVRLGLAVHELEHAVTRARLLGARRSSQQAGETVRLRSPSGFPFVLRSSAPTTEVAPVTTWPEGHRSRVDQLCIDVAPEQWEVELRFWGELTGWELRSAGSPAYARLATPASLPVRVLLQRRDRGPTTGHLDVATTDRPAEVERLQGLGATSLHDGARWTTLRPPVGPPVCVTDRDPATGLLRS